MIGRILFFPIQVLGSLYTGLLMWMASPSNQADFQREDKSDE
ncbi:hypothetical protein FHS27_005015 [Rhodopirellula rubra]|uniref:Uncharacterized protein n=1 Tax=Aporhodopirellula rubra TaxID=980271 RepID=A0A7W5E4G1_9BACT|nr:hypothetical protein [Aporhodopirellula rubra]MBB3209177.1 hypothetical protein [Aporhodopirellula rubra]